ncbi:hypothetical protein G6F22_016321 [Rhizopus arrhizus]|nr:hypothetical protein G6F22_016321 [Rhizopus arrhizus]
MPMRVVDRLEVVDVQQQHRKAAALTRGNGDFAPHHRRQKAPVQHVGERVAAALDLGHHVEQAIEQMLDARHQLLQLAHLIGHRHLLLRVRQHQSRQHHVVQPRHSFGDLTQRWRTCDPHAALVLQPQPDLRGRQPRQRLLRRAVMQADQHGLAPFQQRGALALAFGRDVLPQRKQAVRFVVARAAVDIAHEGAAHLLDRQIEQITDVLRGNGGRRPIQVACAQAFGDFVLQDAGAGHHQMDRDMDAGMHFAHLLLGRHQRGDITLVAHTEQAFQPVLHAAVE